MYPQFPIAFFVQGTPVSLQATPAGKHAWMQRVADTYRHSTEEGAWVTTENVAVTLFYFPDEPMEGDLDNIIKPVLDALNRNLYVDDHQVERILIQRFSRDEAVIIPANEPMLRQALGVDRPVLYVRVDRIDAGDL